MGGISWWYNHHRREPWGCERPQVSWKEGTFKSKEQNTHGGAPAYWSSAPKAAVNLSVSRMGFVWEPRAGGRVLLQVTKQSLVPSGLLCWKAL